MTSRGNPYHDKLGRFTTKTLYHGTTSDKLPGIREQGLIAPTGVMPSGWPMLTDSYDQAARYAQGHSGQRVVLEYQVPETEIWSRQNRQGALWPGQGHDAYDFNATSYALRKPLPAKYLRKVHGV